jgi:hypothetical protein
MRSDGGEKTRYSVGVNGTYSTVAKGRTEGKKPGAKKEQVRLLAFHCANAGIIRRKIQRRLCCLLVFTRHHWLLKTGMIWNTSAASVESTKIQYWNICEVVPGRVAPNDFFSTDVAPAGIHLALTSASECVVE